MRKSRLKLSGETYFRRGVHSNKQSAIKEAKHFREEGYNARVIKGKYTGTNTSYFVYTSRYKGG